MSDVLDNPIGFEEPVVLVKPKRPALHRISIIWDGPGTFINSALKVDEACRNIRECIMQV